MNDINYESKESSSGESLSSSEQIREEIKSYSDDSLVDSVNDGKRKVLIIDDVQINIAILKDILGISATPCDEALSGTIALQMLQERIK